MKITSLLVIAGILGSFGAAAHAAAPYPNKPIKIVVGYTTGSSVDLVARVIAPKLGEHLGQSVIIENRGGAGGNIGADSVSRAAPDGYTLLAVNTSLSIAPALYKHLSFSPTKDLMAVAQMTSMPMVLVAPVDLKANSIADLAALSATQPGGLNLGSAGVGNTDHLAGELLKSMAHLDRVVHIPYKGGAEVITAVISGNVSLFFSGLPGALPMLKAGRLKGLGVSTAKRSWALPDMPAIAETLPGYDVSLWYGLMAPAGTPPAIAEKISQAIAMTLKEPDVVANLQRIGADIHASSPAQFQALFNGEVEKWGKVVRDANITAD